MVPIVAMNGCNFIFPTSTPFTAPIKNPSTRQTTIHTGIGSPIFASCAPIHASSAREEPTDRSIPPEIITHVIPIPIKPYVTACVIIVATLVADK